MAGGSKSFQWAGCVSRLAGRRHYYEGFPKQQVSLGITQSPRHKNESWSGIHNLLETWCQIHVSSSICGYRGHERLPLVEIPLKFINDQIRYYFSLTKLVTCDVPENLQFQSNQYVKILAHLAQNKYYWPI